VVVLAVLVACGGAISAGDEAPPKVIKLGVLSGMFRDVPPSLVHAAATPFQDLFKKQTGVESEVEMLEHCDSLASQLKEKKLHFGVFHGFEWAWLKGRNPELQPLAVTVPPKKIQACLVIHSSSKVEKPAELQGTCVAVPLGAKAHTYLYLDRLQHTLPPGCCRLVPNDERGSDEVLDSVSEGKTTAALMDLATLAAYQDSKPGKGRRLKVLCQSDPFPPTVIVFRTGGVDLSTVEKIRSGLVKAKDNPHGRAFLFLWQLKGFEESNGVYEAELQTVLKAYPPPPPGMPTSPR
jgi:ABC-type phosphate/phosphonate transport system substrate-binding protein